MRYPAASKERLRAPKSQFRVVAVDVKDVSGNVYQVGDFQTLATAQAAARERAGVGSPVFVYDDAGEVLVRLGSWH
ncbi:MAG: hypothetical protein LAO06_06705 [Acidobacteriia bacterium]|nr:hypothetical protein [Terriglobia bacterium]